MRLKSIDIFNVTTAARVNLSDFMIFNEFIAKFYYLLDIRDRDLGGGYDNVVNQVRISLSLETHQILTLHVNLLYSRCFYVLMLPKMRKKFIGNWFEIL